jgi:hypothetical protein
MLISTAGSEDTVFVLKLGSGGEPAKKEHKGVAAEQQEIDVAQQGSVTTASVAPGSAARIKDERWRSAGRGLEPKRAEPRLSVRSSKDHVLNKES